MLHGFSSPDPDQSDPFRERYKSIIRNHRARIGSDYSRLLFPEFGQLIGTHAEWRSFIEDAVAEDAPPSRELILGNSYLAVWERYLGLGQVSSFPTTIGVSITDICNARCNFCAYAPERIAEKKVTIADIERADWLKFSKTFRPNTGLGEPFAHPRSVELFAAIAKLAPFIDISVVSNGSLMRPALLEIVVGWFKSLFISLNAASQKTYEETMRPLKWQKLIDNLTAMRDAKRIAGTDLPRLSAGFVVHKHNLEDLALLPDMLVEFGFSRLHVEPMIPPPNCSISASLLSSEDSIYTVPHRASEIFRELERQCSDRNIFMMNRMPSEELLITGSRPVYTSQPHDRHVHELRYS